MFLVFIIFSLLTAGTPPQLVGVPTHFYKVVLADPAASPQSCNHQEKVVGAFVMPNVPVDPNTPLSSFAVPLSALEEVAGELVYKRENVEQSENNVVLHVLYCFIDVLLSWVQVFNSSPPTLQRRGDWRWTKQHWHGNGRDSWNQGRAKMLPYFYLDPQVAQALDLHHQV